MENEKESVAYATGLITGAKQILLKIQKRIREKPAMFHSSLYPELIWLMNEVNNFPTVEESGSFVVDPATEEINFEPKS